MSLVILWFGSVTENCLDFSLGFSSSGDRDDREEPVEERRVGLEKLKVLLIPPVK